MNRFSVTILVGTMLITSIASGCSNSNGEESMMSTTETTLSVESQPAPSTAMNGEDAIVVVDYVFATLLLDMRTEQNLGDNEPLILDGKTLGEMSDNIEQSGSLTSVSFKSQYVVLPFAFFQGGTQVSLLEKSSENIVVGVVAPCPDSFTTQALTGTTLVVPVSDPTNPPKIEIVKSVAPCEN